MYIITEAMRTFEAFRLAYRDVLGFRKCRKFMCAIDSSRQAYIIFVFWHLDGQVLSKWDCILQGTPNTFEHIRTHSFHQLEAISNNHLIELITSSPHVTSN